MNLFPYGHATHPQWEMAAGLVLAQLRAHMALPEYADAPSLGLLYITDRYAQDAQDILSHLSAELPEVTDWVGTVGVGVAANNVEYFDEPALSVMLCDISPEHYRVFSGVAPLAQAGTSLGGRFVPHTALLHADAGTPDVPELIAELAQRTARGYVFGGLSASRGEVVQFALNGDGNMAGQGKATGVFHGGLSGVAFDAEVAMVSRVTQGCLPVAPTHIITSADNNVVLTLDGEPALHVLTRDLKINLTDKQPAIAKVRTTLVGLSDAHDPAVKRTGEFDDAVLVRHIIGIDPERDAVAVAQLVDVGMRLTFCQRNAAAARADLKRICAEIREALEPEEMTADLASALREDASIHPHPARRMAGAIYVSCAGRGGPHFGGESAEMHIVRRTLGDVPLVGFFASGEIAHQALHGYTGVLTVFITEA
ncbi:FIST N-terminal domain-containing protein [Limnohabitans sp.]|uniref:FIST signal transduction protein n=1 Tax=Limnohabitans sp. TaxID=1907725 RepID=UPI00286EDFB6|nr:FIST N-terminal domain-containing protein [Limnohabitans sp.]